MAFVTQTKYAGRVRAARPQLLELFAEQPIWLVGDLRATCKLEEPVLQELLSDLLGSGTIRQRFVDPSGAVAAGEMYSLNAPQAVPAPTPFLSPLAQKVMTYLVGRKVTLPDICTAVHSPKEEVVQVLAFLDDNNLVTCRYVGRLPIFSMR